MKKYILAMLTVFCLMTVVLSGCGSETEDRTRTDRKGNSETEGREKEDSEASRGNLFSDFADLVSTGEGPHVTYLDPDELSISDVVKAEKNQGGSMYGYMNIALFGVDAPNSNQLYKNSRSDTIMIASINLDTGDIKLVSVYRDSYLYCKWPQGVDNAGNISAYKEAYDKCNSAYARGGALSAVQMLNMNLDLDITSFITVGYAGLAKLIDSLGGIWIDVDKAEMQHINNYQYSILGKYAANYGIDTASSNLNFTPDEYFKDYDVIVVDTPGYQRLNGLQAAAYCRIRYVGNDFERTARQREVIKAIEAQAKQADLSTLIKAFENVVDSIYTNLDAETILTKLLPNIKNYRVVDESGFPELDKLVGVNMGAKGACEIALDLSASVSGLHEFLFEDNNFEASDTVKKISQQIQADASKYRSFD